MKLVLGVERIVHIVAGFSFGIVICSGCFLISTAGVAAVITPRRDRIERYVAAGQMFLIQDPNKINVLLEKPNAPITPSGNVKWFCTPQKILEWDENSDYDKTYDNVVSHMLTFRPAQEVADLQQQGGEMKGTWETGGFTTAWENDSDAGYMVAYGDLRIATLIEIRRGEYNQNTTSSWFSNVVYLEPSTPKDTSGMIASAVVEWTLDAADPRLVEMAKDLGKELTGETCEEKYAEVWNSVKNSSTTSSKSSSVMTTTIMTITTISALFCMLF